MISIKVSQLKQEVIATILLPTGINLLLETLLLKLILSGFSMDKMRPLSKFSLSRSCISIASVLFCAVTLWLYFEIEEEFVGSEELQLEESVTSWIKDLSEKKNCDQNNTSTLLYSNQAEVSQNCHIFSSDDKGIKTQCLKGEVAEIAGNVGSKSSGGLEGCAEIVFVDGRRQIASFINGTRHGLVSCSETNTRL